MSEVTDKQRWKELQKRLKAAKVALRENEKGALPFPYAMRVFATFGPYLDVTPLYFDKPLEVSEETLLGWQRRSWNGILCAEKVLPFWIANPLTESNIVDELNRAKEIVKNGKPIRRQFIWRLQPDYDEINGEFLQKPQSADLARAATAFLAAEDAINFTFHDVESPFELDIDYEDPNVHNYEPQRNPNVFWASLVFAGGKEWNFPFEDNKARRKFWQWWLNKAVPASWNLEEI